MVEAKPWSHRVRQLVLWEASVQARLQDVTARVATRKE